MDVTSIRRAALPHNTTANTADEQLIMTGRTHTGLAQSEPESPLSLSVILTTRVLAVGEG